MRELLDARPRPLGGAVEILRPVGEPLLDLRLRRGQGLREHVSGLALPIDELLTALLRDSPLLLDQERHRVRAGPRKRSLELRRALRRLRVDLLVEPGLRLGESVIRLAEADERPPQEQ